MLVLAGVALAFWIVPSAAGPQGSSKAAQLTAPTGPTATVNGSGSITIGWTIPGTQLTGAQYRVTRTTGAGAGVVCTVAAPTAACTETGLTANTTYTYAVTTVLSSWSSAAITTSPTTATPTFVLTPSAAPYTAGVAFSVTQVQAKIASVVDTTYSGSKSITWSDLTSSPGGTAPTYGGASVTFTNGVGTPTGTFKTFRAGSETLRSTDAAVAAVTGTVGLTVVPTAISGFTVPNPGTQTAGVAFNETITAIDSFGNAALNWISATKCVTFSGPLSSPNATAPSYPVIGACSAGQSSLSFGATGQATATITLRNAAATTVTVTEPVTAKTGSSGSFTVSPAVINAFTVLSPGTQTAGVAFTETITAIDTFGNAASGWISALKCVTFSGPLSSPNATAPSYPVIGACS
ncbi:MAG: Mucin-22, partial [Frankiales bacterium]|nr:Mucin-22 [Frankiales bacterium]